MTEVFFWGAKKPTEIYYDGINSTSIPATINTAYKWSFASNKTCADDDALRNAREEVGAATYGQDPIPSVVSLGKESSSRPSGGIQEHHGFDQTLAREQAAENCDEESPRPAGREGILEKKLKQENDSDFIEKGDEGLEIDVKSFYRSLLKRMENS